MAILPNYSSNLVSRVSTTSFTLETNAAMFQMLTKNVYSNIILAGIRELSSNAIDACIAAGVEPRFDVCLPTTDDLTFSVRDYGSGLSSSSIEGLYSTVGASSKRESNAYNGCFGIGKLAPLAYATSFTVESFHAGTHLVYLVSIKDGIPSYLKLSETPTSEPSGLLVSYAVQPSDISKFHSEAKHLYRFFSTKPNLNIEFDYPSPTLEGADYCVYPNLNGTYFVMANVPYLYRSTVASGLCINIPTGSVSINPGRETLTYDAATEAYLDSVISRVKSDITASIVSNIQAYPTLFEQAVAYNAANRFSFVSLATSDISPAFASTFTRWGEFANQPSFLITGGSTYDSRFSNHFVTPNPDKPLIVQDVPTGFITCLHACLKSLNQSSAHVVRPHSNTKTAIATMLANLPSYLAHIGYTGLVHYMSTYVVATTKTVSTKLASSIFQARTLDGFVWGNIDTSTSTDTFYYFLEQPASYYSDYAKLVPHVFIVIPKKAHTLVATLPNFHLVTDTLLQSLLDAHPHVLFTDAVHDLRHTSKLDHVPSTTTKLPVLATQDLALSYVESPQASRVRSLLKQNHFSIPHSYLDVPHTLEDLLAAYPLLPNLQQVWPSDARKQSILHYISIEDQLHALSSSS